MAARVDILRAAMRVVEQPEHDLSVDFRYLLTVMLHRLLGHVLATPDVTVHGHESVSFTWAAHTDGTVRLTFAEHADHYTVEHTTDTHTATWCIKADWGDDDVFETVTTLISAD